MKTIGVIALSLFLFACGENPRPPAPGGGEHKITRITIEEVTKDHHLQNPEGRTLHVGEKAQLQVWAAWAIPYMGDVTENAQLRVTNPSIGTLDKQAVFTARMPGKTSVQAVLRVAEGTGGHEVLGPDAPLPPNSKLVEFRDEVALTVVP